MPPGKRWRELASLTALRNNKESSLAGRRKQLGGEGKEPWAVPRHPDPLAVAFRMLARRPYSIAEMRQALERKFPQKGKVSEAVSRLRELGYLDDRKFAEQTAYSLAQNRVLGPHRLRRELKARKVDYQYVGPAVEHAYQATPVRTLLEQALEKKLRTLRLPLTRARFYSLCQTLMRRGFDASDVIKAVRARPELRTVADDIESADFEASAQAEDPQQP
jgi:regulatory protein